MQRLPIVLSGREIATIAVASASVLWRISMIAAPRRVVGGAPGADARLANRSGWVEIRSGHRTT